MKCTFMIIAAICLTIKGSTSLPLSSISISGGTHSTHESTSLYHETTGPLTTTTTVLKQPSLLNLRSSGLISINGLGLPTIGNLPVLGGLTTTLTGSGLPLLNPITGIRHHIIGGNDLGHISHITTTADLPSSVLYTTNGGFDTHYVEHPILSKSHSHIVTADSNIDNTVVQQDGVYKAVSAGAVHIAPLPGRGSTTSINT